MEKELVKSFKVFADTNRMEIVELLLKGETCGCTLIDKLPISQPTLSYHLKNITASGLASARRDGNWIKYTIDRSKINDMITYLEQLRDMESTTCNL